MAEGSPTPTGRGSRTGRGTGAGSTASRLDAFEHAASTPRTRHGARDAELAFTAAPRSARARTAAREAPGTLRASSVVPSKSSSPRYIIPTRSVTVSRRSRSLDTMRTVAPLARCSARSRSKIFCDVTGSSPAAGSSYSTMGARVTVARATPTRFFCPPLSPDGMRSSKPGSDTHARRSATRSRTSSSGGRVEAAQGERDVVETVRWSKSALFWKSIPMRLRISCRAQLGGVGHAVVAHLHRCRGRASSGR